MVPVFLTLFIGCINYIKYASCLCSSYDYANNIRSILAQQDDYDVYEGKLTFRLNASSEYGTNPSGIYATTYFDNFYNVTNPNSIVPYLSYYLRPSSALIFSGCTPPKSLYFSWTSYILYRYNDYANGTRNNYKMLWSDLGASLNNLVWNTRTNKDNITNNYDSLTTIIQTGDGETYDDLHNILTVGGISSHEINLQSLPNKYIDFLPYKYSTDNINEYNKTYDTGMILIRVSVPENKDEYEQYIHTNQSVFLLDPKDTNPDTSQPKQPYEAVRRNTYSDDNFNETSIYRDILKQYEKDLINYLSETYNYSYVSSSTFWNAAIGDFHTDDYGFGCIQQNENCGGDCRDAQYWQLDPVKTNKDNEYYIILGVMHSNPDIQQSLYSNIVIEDMIDGNDLHITMLQYNGSGLILPVKTDINKDYLKNIFVVQWTSPNLCIDELPGFCQEFASHLPTLNIRDYLNKYTKTRPDLTEIVPAILIKFKQ